jgi:phage tail-like protein
LSHQVATHMSDISSYIQYLPPVLRTRENDPDQLLGRILCIFEKILTGRIDGVPLTVGTREYCPFEQAIDELPQLFDPWHTPTAMLPYLATWLGLDLPDWGEFQQRRLVAAIGSICQRHGTREALLDYLDIYAAAYGQPRIAIDDGEAVFRARFGDDGTALLIPIAYSQTVASEQKRVSVLLHPAAVAVGRDGAVIVVDQGDMGTNITPAIWRLSSSGEIPYGGSPPLPQPFYAGSPLREPTAIAVDSTHTYVADLGSGSQTLAADASLYRFTLDRAAAETVLSPRTHPGWAVRPVDMAFDANQNLVVLDRGAHPIGDPPSQEDQGAAQPRIVIVRRGSVAAVHNLDGIIEPTALAIDTQGHLIVTDAGDQQSTRPAGLWRIDPGDGWRAAPLLDQVPHDRNPLIFPIALAIERAMTLLICDTGVRWGWDGDSWNRTLAETAAIYRVDLAESPPVITCVARDRRLVMPTKMALDQQGRLFISDRGELRKGAPPRNWRAGTSEFGVVVLFSQQRPTLPEARDRLRREIIDKLEAYKPAESVGWVDY